MYTICYVVVDDGKLKYYNELLISLASLRRHEPEVPVIVLTDEMTATSIGKQDHDDLGNLKAGLRVIQIPGSYSLKEKSRFIKTSMREYVSGDFLYIDTDTVIAEPLDLCFNGELALVLDYNIDMKQRQDIGDLQNLVKMNERCGYTLDVEWPYYNSGCIWAKDTAMVHEFFHRWHEEWKHSRESGFIFDQPSLNYVNREMNGLIQELDGVYNVQIANRIIPINLIYKAKIIHYFNGIRGMYLLQKPEIKALGYQSEIVQKIISCPKEAFLISRLAPAKSYNLENSEIYCILKELYGKNNLLFRIINYPFSLWLKIKKTIKSMLKGKRIKKKRFE